MDVRKIRIEDYDYPLAEERIALHPLAQRDGCKLLVEKGGRISHHIFSELPLLLKPDTLIVANETKVIRARMEFVKDSGARIEIFLLEPYMPSDYVTNFASDRECSWVCLVGNRKRWKEGALKKTLAAADGTEYTLEAEIAGEVPANGVIVRFRWDNAGYTFAEVVETAGNIPIPPYLKRKSEESDTTDYQTVYSRTEGSVAAPTAGLHFTPELLSELRHHGCDFTTVTLHVGAGTFQPVKSEEIGDHPMHTEWISVSRMTLRKVITALEEGRDILAVGTTTVRTLESLPYMGVTVSEGQLEVKQWMPYEERLRHIDTIRSLKRLLQYMDREGLDSLGTTTSIMIAPGFRWRVVGRMITNFHQPKSTLLLLVSSFLGGDRWKAVYGEALEKGYRFLSYGDACLFSRGSQPAELPLAKSMVIRAATLSAVLHPDNPELLDRYSYGLCDDSEYYIKALKALLADYKKPEADKDDTFSDIYIGEGAAPLRFFVAVAASMPGVAVKVTCGEGLRKRPIRPLIDCLLSMGADIQYNDSVDDWNITVRGKKLAGGKVEVDSSFTSQFLSALLLASPLWDKPLYLGEECETRVSKPYLLMTQRMLANPDIKPESDWSAAAFFYEYALITGKDVKIASLTPPAVSLQGDSACCDLYSSLGVNTEFHHDGSATLRCDREAYLLARERGRFEFDFTDFPDMVPSVAVALCYRQLPFTFRGVSHLRYKECDRLNAICTLLMKVGYEVRVENDILVYDGEFKPYEEFPLEIDPYGDHRMAMAFYPLELLGMVKVEDKQVVAKSFPDFYQQF